MFEKRISDLLFESVVEFGDIIIINNRVLCYKDRYYEIIYQISGDYCVSHGKLEKYFIGYREYDMFNSTISVWVNIQGVIY